MKRQCPCPDYINTPSGPFTNTIHLFKEHNTILHGKKATYECPVCGAGLCDECAIPKEGLCIGSWVVQMLCPGCAEEL